MKIAATFVALAFAQDEDDERKFSNKPEWIDGADKPNYGNKDADERFAQMRCRVDQYFNQWFTPVSEDEKRAAKQAWVNGRLRQIWGSLLDDIESTYEECAEEPDSIKNYVAHGKECNYTKWLDLKFKKSLHEFVSWAGVFVRKNIHKNTDKKRCEPNGMRLFKRIDRLNAYIQWQYCDKFDETAEPCTKYRYNTVHKKFHNPRNTAAHTEMKKFEHQKPENKKNKT